MMRILFSGLVALVFGVPMGAWTAESVLPPKRPAAPRSLSLLPVPTPLLAFVDERTQDRHGVLLGEWASEVSKEGLFAVEWVRSPRVETWTSTNRVPAVRAILDKIQERKPKAVMLWGAVGWVGTGIYDPDGHGPRVAWTDVPFAAGPWTWTDTNHFGVTYAVALGQNVPGDGKWDQIFDGEGRNRAVRSVGRVDFSNLKSAKPVSNVDEDQAMIDYLRRNLEYRRGRGFTNEVVILASFMTPDTKLWIKTNLVGRSVRDIPAVDFTQTYPVAGERFFALYTSIVPYLREGFRDASGTMTSTLWAMVYKSYAGDPWNVAETERQYLRQSLVVTFGGPHWLPNGATVHEAYLRHSYPGLAGLVAEDTLLGDVTLKLR